MTDREKYEKFIKYMWNPVWEFVESEHLMPMIESYITPEQAVSRLKQEELRPLVHKLDSQLSPG